MVLGRFTVLVSFGMIALLAVCTVAEAQRGGGQRGGFGRGGGGGFGFGGRFGGGAGPLAVIQRDDVQKELGLTQSQIAKVGELEQEGGPQRGAFENFRDLSQEERQEAFGRMREEREKRQQELRTQINAILNPSQKSRFSQLEFQFALQRGNMFAPQGGNVANALSSAGMTLSEEEQRKVEETEDQVMDRAREEMARIQRDAQIEILTSVVGADRANQLIGEPFQFEAEARPRFGRGGGGRGNRADTGRPQRPQQEDDNQTDRSSRRRRRAG